MHKNSLSSVQSHFITKNSTRVISQRGGLAVLPCSVTMSTPATVSKYLYIISLNRKTNPETLPLSTLTSGNMDRKTVHLLKIKGKNNNAKRNFSNYKR